MTQHGIITAASRESATAHVQTVNDAGMGVGNTTVDLSGQWLATDCSGKDGDPVRRGASSPSIVPEPSNHQTMTLRPIDSPHLKPENAKRPWQKRSSRSIPICREAQKER
jgi:hypothetical protein